MQSLFNYITIAEYADFAEPSGPGELLRLMPRMDNPNGRDDEGPKPSTMQHALAGSKHSGRLCFCLFLGKLRM